LGVTLLCTNGQGAFGAGVGGHLEGTSGDLFGTPDRNDDQTITDNDHRITEMFDDIVAGAVLVGRLNGEDVFGGSVLEAIGDAFKEAMKSFGQTIGHEVALIVLHRGSPQDGHN
jgi:hypothetical protein